GLHWEFAAAFRIGRNDENEIVVNDPSVARRHAEIAPSRSGWSVRDMGSASGTFVHDTRVVGSPTALRPRDVLRCGNIVFDVAYTGSTGSTPFLVETPRPAESLSDTKIRPILAGAERNVHVTGAHLRVQAVAQHSWEQALEAVAVRASQRAGPSKPLL